MRRFLGTLAVAGALLAAVPAVAQVPRRPMMQNRRSMLQERVHQRFMEILSQRLQLTDEQRDQVSAILQKDMQDRMDLARRSGETRRQLVQATADTTTDPAKLQSILNDMDRLRREETALATREDSALATVLTPRQRAEFIMLRARFNERVRQIRGGGMPPDRPGPPPGNGRGPPPF